MRFLLACSGLQPSRLVRSSSDRPIRSVNSINIGSRVQGDAQEAGAAALALSAGKAAYACMHRQAGVLNVHGRVSPGPATAFSLNAAATVAGSCSSFSSHSCGASGLKEPYMGAAWPSALNMQLVAHTLCQLEEQRTIGRDSTSQPSAGQHPAMQRIDP